MYIYFLIFFQRNLEIFPPCIRNSFQRKREKFRAFSIAGNSERFLADMIPRESLATLINRVLQSAH